MRYVEYGNQNPETIILLHGGGLSWWNYREVALLLADKYHVVLPILDGHADSDEPFTSIEDNAARLIAYIDEHHGGSVYALGGLSLGGQIAVEMLTQRSDICRFARKCFGQTVKVDPCANQTNLWDELWPNQAEMVCQIAGSLSGNPPDVV